jgi:phosphatidylglycerol:prolipoprotein diacylglycerol transferase
MLTFPHIDPVALKIGPIFGFGPLSIHWYGVMYLAAFLLFYWLGTRRLAHPPYRHLSGTAAWTRQDIEDILFLGVMGVIVGGRVGYCLFYKPGYYLANPLEILAVWQGGMSFHGGMLGVVVAEVWFAFSRKRSLLQVADLVAPCVPTGLALGRLGNFINGELPGRVADSQLAWAMVFPKMDALPRHPSQLYQFALEGVLLFVVLWWFARKERRPGRVSALFLVGYGGFRFFAEFFREPDAHLGYLSLGLSMGQWLCVPMVLGGVALWFWPQKKPA